MFSYLGQKTKMTAANQAMNSTIEHNLGCERICAQRFVKVETDVILPNKHVFPSVTSDDFFWASGIYSIEHFHAFVV
ncbi:hypothetical protein C5167_035514 [Papaver somniferum]|uniref:Uncharacterized protein n=1 Tax=Papaver somniferum TaxID=3469 RepID=A0A4Y7KJM7_PAPSO|nr:hypothetical protein C5167_035514 [Papaver somniferum]